MEIPSYFHPEGIFFTHIVDGTHLCPEQFLGHENGVLTSQETPEYHQWIAKDQALLLLLNATLSQSAVPLVIGQKTTRGVWETLEMLFTSISCSNVPSIKMDLHNLKKNNNSISPYLQGIKEYKDKLELVALHVDDE